MPIIESTFSPLSFLRHPDAQTIVPALFRYRTAPPFSRHRITTPDNDFIDVDTAQSGVRAAPIAILCHGMEGSTRSSYMKGMAAYLLGHDFTIVAWNMRGCSGEPNLLARSYHSGSSDDLRAVVNHVRTHYPATPIVLIGFSMGGNIALKYLGEEGSRAGSDIKGAVVFSVPCDLGSASRSLALPRNRIYMRSFLSSLKDKLEAKQSLRSHRFDLSDYESIRSFEQFDQRFTAPLNGFKSVEDYWRSCSSAAFLPEVAVPTLIVNAQDDPFLAPECFPEQVAKESRSVFLEIPKRGGHVGFLSFSRGSFYWSERRAHEFLQRCLA